MPRKGQKISKIARRTHISSKSRLVVLRKRQRAERQDRADRAAMLVPQTEAEKIALYRTEKARSEERNAPKKAELMAAVERALAKADALAVERGRGGRPKGTGKHRGPSIHVGKSDPRDLLRRSRM